jgi:hypothetical protein
MGSRISEIPIPWDSSRRSDQRKNGRPRLRGRTPKISQRRVSKSPTRTRTLNLAVNPGAPGLALSIEQLLADRPSRLRPLDLSLTPHGRSPRWVLFGSDEFPRAVLQCVLAQRGAKLIVLGETTIQVVGLTNVKTAVLVFEDVHPKYRSGVCQTPRQGLEP